MTANWFDTALAAADRLSVEHLYGEPAREARDLVLRALREAIALNRGILTESTGLRQRVEALSSGKADLAEISDADLLAEIGRRL